MQRCGEAEMAIFTKIDNFKEKKNKIDKYFLSLPRHYHMNGHTERLLNRNTTDIYNTDTDICDISSGRPTCYTRTASGR